MLILNGWIKKKSDMNRTFYKLIVLILIILGIVLFFTSDLHHHITFDNLKARQADLESFYAGNTLLTIAVYAATYIIMAALSLPGAAVMTLAGGALFGLLLLGVAGDDHSLALGVGGNDDLGLEPGLVIEVEQELAGGAHVVGVELFQVDVEVTVDGSPWFSGPSAMVLIGNLGQINPAPPPALTGFPSVSPLVLRQVLRPGQDRGRQQPLRM